MTARPSSRRGGFTLVEFLVVAVLGSLLVIATYQVLVTNRQTFTVQNAQLQNQQQLRGALEVLLAELREVSPAGGDIISANSTTLQIRSMENWGVVCDITYGSTPVMKVKQYGDWFDTTDSLFVFADNRTDIATDDTWLEMLPTAQDTTQTCDGTDKAQNLSFAGQSSLIVADSVRVGALIRKHQRHTWQASSWNGDYYLTRQGPSDASPVPIVGPLVPGSQSRNPVSFRYLDEHGAATTTMTDVQQIEVKVFTWSPVMDQDGQNVQDSLVLRVNTRN